MSRFDKIFKENIESLLPSLSQHFFGLDLSKATFKTISPSIVRAVDREVDFLKRVKIEGQAAFILHIEFQTYDDADMLYRMAEYKAILQRKYQLEVRQYVLYLGESRSSMQIELPNIHQITGYELIEINRWKPTQVLNSGIPELIIMAILSDYPRSDAQQIVNRILKKLLDLNLAPNQLKARIQQLMTLAQIRKLDTIIFQEVNKMPIELDITESVLYQKGKESGFEQGLSEGLTKGKETGFSEGLIHGMLLSEKFTIQEIAKQLKVSEEQVLQIQQKMRGRA